MDIEEFMHIYTDPDFIDIPPEKLVKMFNTIKNTCCKESIKGTIIIVGTGGEIDNNNFKDLWNEMDKKD